MKTVSKGQQLNPTSPYGVVFLFHIGTLKDDRHGYYDSTRHYWDVIEKWRNRDNAIALGMIEGISVAGYQIQNWHQSPTISEKFEFDGLDLGAQHELLDRDFKPVLERGKGFWARGGFIVVEFDGMGQFKLLRGAAAANKNAWIKL